MTSELRHRIIDISHRLAAKGFVAATDGNVSARLPGGTILATRSGINKGMVAPEDIVEVSPEGSLLAGAGRPSTELGMHLFIYRERPDVQAVVHAHPPYATGFATARRPLDQCLFPEVIVGLGSIPLAPYATPSTGQVAASIAPYVATHQAVLMTNHGAVTWGADLLEAYFRMEKVEHAAHVAFVAAVLGGAVPLDPSQVEQLRDITQTSYGKSPDLADMCSPSHDTDLQDDERTLRRYIEEALQKRGVIR